ncbi:MAG: zinc ribbon domain-containing protein [Lachnospiraceae bacterium]|nr:zinc ribbon domain-containing protein [Lachnospiraceae bacterium]
MAYCGNCGNQIEDGTRFCPMCGAPQDTYADVSGYYYADPAQNTYADVTPIYKKKSFLPALIGSAVAVIAIIVLCVLMGADADDSNLKASNKHEYSEKNYMETEAEPEMDFDNKYGGYENVLNIKPYLATAFKGYDTVGIAVNYYAKFMDTDKVADEIRRINSEISDDEVRRMAGTFSCDIDKKKELSNGDVVKISVRTKASDLYEKYNITLVDEIEYIVSGLTELTEFDPFSEEFVQPEITGVSPFAKFFPRVVSNDTRINNGSYKCDKSENLKEGDIVTVTFNANQKRLAESGFKVKNSTYQYQIQNVTKFIDDVDDIDESVLNEMKGIVTQKIEEWATGNSYRMEKFSISDIKYEGAVLLTLNEIDKSMTSYIGNKAYVICSAIVTDIRDREKTDDFHEPTKVYYPVLFEELMQDANGKQVYGKAGFISDQNCDPLSFGGGTNTAGYVGTEKMYENIIAADAEKYTCTMTDGLKKLFK